MRKLEQPFFLNLPHKKSKNSNDASIVSFYRPGNYLKEGDQLFY